MNKLFVVFFTLLSSSLFGMVSDERRQNEQLLIYAGSGDTTKVVELLNRNADINTQSLIGNTPLHHALVNGTAELINILLERGANTKVKNDALQTPLDVAKGHIPPPTSDVQKTVLAIAQDRTLPCLSTSVAQKKALSATQGRMLEFANLLELYPVVSKEAHLRPTTDTLLKALQYGWPRMVNSLLNRLEISQDDAMLYIQLVQSSFEHTGNNAYKQIEQLIKAQCFPPSDTIIILNDTANNAVETISAATNHATAKIALKFKKLQDSFPKMRYRASY